jgi:hypothetical protein
MKAKIEINYFIHFISKNLECSAINHTCYSHEVNIYVFYILVREYGRLCLMLWTLQWLQTYS